jgi:hypothetical protein
VTNLNGMMAYYWAERTASAATEEARFERCEDDATVLIRHGRTGQLRTNALVLIRFVSPPRRAAVSLSQPSQRALIRRSHIPVAP